MSYQGNYVSAVPVWNPDSLDVVEPPAQWQSSGWQPLLKPPAQWLNFMHQRYYESLKELDDALKSVEDAKVNRAGDTVTGNIVFDNDIGVVGTDANGVNKEILMLRGNDNVTAGHSTQSLILHSDITPVFYDGTNSVDLWHKGNDDNLFYRDGSKAVTGHMNFNDFSAKNVNGISFKDHKFNGEHWLISEENTEGKFTIQRRNNNGVLLSTPFKIDTNNKAYIDDSEILTKSMEGAGNGLNADLLDGLQSGQFIRSDIDDDVNGTLNFNKGSAFVIHHNSYKDFLFHHPTRDSFVIAPRSADGTSWDWSNQLELIDNGTLEIAHNRVLTVGDEGAGNGLNADLVDGVQANQFARRDVDNIFEGATTFKKSITLDIFKKMNFLDNEDNTWQLYADNEAGTEFMINLLGSNDEDFMFSSNPDDYTKAKLMVGGSKAITEKDDVVTKRTDDISNVDWDTLRNGVYDVAVGAGNFNGNLNQPSGAYEWGTLVVTTSGDGMTQIYYPHLASENINDHVWFRTGYSSNGYKAWGRLAKFREVDFKQEEGHSYIGGDTSSDGSDVKGLINFNTAYRYASVSVGFSVGYGDLANATGGQYDTPDGFTGWHRDANDNIDGFYWAFGSADAENEYIRWSVWGVKA